MRGTPVLRQPGGSSGSRRIPRVRTPIEESDVHGLHTFRGELLANTLRLRLGQEQVVGSFAASTTNRRRI